MTETDHSQRRASLDNRHELDDDPLGMRRRRRRLVGRFFGDPEGGGEERATRTFAEATETQTVLSPMETAATTREATTDATRGDYSAGGLNIASVARELGESTTRLGAGTRAIESEGTGTCWGFPKS